MTRGWTATRCGYGNGWHLISCAEGGTDPRVLTDRSGRPVHFRDQLDALLACEALGGWLCLTPLPGTWHVDRHDGLTPGEA